MMKANETEKEKANERETMKESLIEEFKSIISSQIAEPPEKRLQRAGAKIASIGLEKGVAERCATALMEKFATMGSKAPGKSG